MSWDGQICSERLRLDFRVKKGLGDFCAPDWGMTCLHPELSVQHRGVCGAEELPASPLPHSLSLPSLLCSTVWDCLRAVSKH